VGVPLREPGPDGSSDGRNGRHRPYRPRVRPVHQQHRGEQHLLGSDAVDGLGHHAGRALHAEHGDHHDQGKGVAFGLPSNPPGFGACRRTSLQPDRSAAQNLEAAGTSFATQGASATTGAPLFDPTTGAPLYVCTNTAQLAAAQNAPAESDIQGLPSSFKFSNVEFQNDRTHGGQQMQADLEFTVGACVAHYKVLGMQGLSQDTGGPTACGEQADCNPRPTPESTDPNRFDPLLGSGINPDFPVHCDFDVGAYTDWVNEAVFNRTAFVGGFGVCMLDGPFNTTCDSSSDPDCWTKGPLGSTEP